MKNKSGYTLIEILIVGAFSCIVGVIVFSAINGYNATKNGDMNAMVYLNPKVATAQAQIKMANELAEQNRLMREQIELLKKEKENK